MTILLELAGLDIW